MKAEYYKKYEPVFGFWKIKGLIGEGSFGKVFEIERKDFGTTYKAALKVITIPQSSGEIDNLRSEGMNKTDIQNYLKQFVEDIVGEFKLMSMLKGTSNIVSYEDHVVIPHDEGIGWDILIRMELLKPLNEFITHEPITVRDIIKLGIDMCNALELCQKRNIIHRDIKPENIFVSENGDYKLGDFGIARQIEKTTSGMSKKGTYNYMAPEVYRGLPYGPSVDLYSLGIVLYRLINNNRSPFIPPYPHPISHNDRENAVIQRMRGDALPLPVGIKQGRLTEIVLKACAYDPKDRYSSPTQMKEDLLAIQYTENEAKFIFGNDMVDIKSKKYVLQSNGTELMGTEDTVVDEEAEDTVVDELSSKRFMPKKNRKKLIIAGSAVAAAAVIAVTSGILLIDRNTEKDTSVISTEKNTLEEKLSEVELSFKTDGGGIGSVLNSLKERFAVLSREVEVEIKDDAIVARISAETVGGTVDFNTKVMPLLCANGELSVADASGKVLLTNSDMGSVLEESYENGSEAIFISLNTEAATKLNEARSSLTEGTELSFRIDGVDYRTIPLTAETDTSIIKIGSEENPLTESEAKLLSCIVGGEPIDSSVALLCTSGNEEIIVPDKIQWRNEGYESVAPYKAYERKYVNGEMTGETRYNGEVRTCDVCGSTEHIVHPVQQAQNKNTSSGTSKKSTTKSSYSGGNSGTASGSGSAGSETPSSTGQSSGGNSSKGDSLLDYVVMDFD